MHARSPRLISLLLAGALGACASPGDSAAFDPVAMDAPRGEPPAESPDLQFFSEGAHLNAVGHIASGPGPHPTVVLLHGFPGNERNLDLAQALRRAGWNAFFFSYRGAWGSGGEFSFGNALADVAAVVATLREPEFARKYRVDPERIVLVGHSLGGAVSLVSAARLGGVRCAASLAGANLGAFGQRASASAESAARMAALFQTWGEGRIREVSGEQIVADLIAHRDAYSAASHAAVLARKPILLVAGARDVVTPPDQHHAPLIAAIRAHGGQSLREVTLDSDHAFSDTRIALAHTVIDWLSESCRPAPAPQ